MKTKTKRHRCPACGERYECDETENHMNEETTFGNPEQRGVRICDDCFQKVERIVFSQINFE